MRPRNNAPVVSAPRIKKDGKKVEIIFDLSNLDTHGEEMAAKRAVNSNGFERRVHYTNVKNSKLRIVTGIRTQRPDCDRKVNNLLRTLVRAMNASLQQQHRKQLEREQNTKPAFRRPRHRPADAVTS